MDILRAEPTSGARIALEAALGPFGMDDRIPALIDALWAIGESTDRDIPGALRGLADDLEKRRG